MADVITRFKLETTQYDSKLRDEAKRLSDFARQASIAGKEFGKFAQSNVEAARAFGNIAVSATNAKDKVKELVGAFNTVAKEYNMLTKEQQQSDFGKALAESMTTLKGRIAEAKQEMNSTGGILGQLREKFVINIDAVKLFNTGINAAKAVLDVARDAFFNNEQQLDEWGRIVESSESLYKGFLTAINTGDVSGFLQHIDDITKAARDAYNALDELNTFNAFNQINVEKTRTGMTESIVDYREGNTTKGAVRAAGEAYKKELEERRRLEKDAYLKKVAEVAAQRGVSASDLTTALSGKYGSYKALKDMPMSGTRTVVYGGGMFGGGGSYQQAVPGSVQEKLGDALRRLNDDELKNLQALGAQAERTSNEIAQVDKQLIRVLNGRQGSTVVSGGGGGRSGTANLPTSQSFEKFIAKSTLNADKFKPEDIISPPSVWEQYGKDIAGSIETINDSMNNLSVEGFAESYNQVEENVKKMNEALEQQQMAFSMAGQAATNFGAALAGLDDPAAKAAGTVISAIANIALGFGQAVAQAGSMGPWAWLAYVAAGTAALATTISTVHSLTGYAEGGMIKGNSYSGDNIGGLVDGNQLVGLNAGEIVLNAAQSASVAQGLQGGNMRNINLQAVASGEQLWLVMNNHTKRTGKGEIVTWR